MSPIHFLRLASIARSARLGVVSLSPEECLTLAQAALALFYRTGPMWDEPSGEDEEAS